ncbi:Hypothetical protein A7982_08398 [Minicystis rosea]|nr:Hypothetical protein A7982_08398 [Minicystis rosea]
MRRYSERDLSNRRSLTQRSFRDARFVMPGASARMRDQGPARPARGLGPLAAPS